MTDAQVEAALDEREVDLVARAMFEEDKSRWVEPDYSQHEFVLRGFAKCAIRALTAAREAGVPYDSNRPPRQGRG